MSLLQIHEPGQSPDPHDRELAVGIDLGTTHSVVSVVKEDAPVALEDAQGHSIVPSALFYAGGQDYVGRDAFVQARKQGTHPLQSIKRMIGYITSEVQQSFPELAAQFTSDADAMPELRIDGRNHSPISMSADILHHIKQIASAALEQDISKAVITVPAYFDDAARQATRQAAQLCGLDVLRLINEPTAAALAYGLEHQSEGIYAIYDLGGGTFDMSLLNLDKGVFQVLATAGDTQLGGGDVDAAIAAHLMQKYDLKAEHSAMLAASRALKEALSEQAQATHDIQGKEITLTRDELSELLQPFIKRTLAICDAALNDADLSINELHGVVMVGGSTRLLAVQDAVKEYFGCTIHNNLDPDRVVAFGAAIQAKALTQGSDHLLLDVTPLSLGLETMGGIVEKLIHRNTPIPSKESQEFTTFKDGQTAMQIHVVQGEREMVDQCRSLAQFELTGIPPLPAGIARIEVSFVIDADGLLRVSAEEKVTGIRQSVDVKPSYGLPIDDIEAMIRESMEHGRDDIMLRLLVETRIDALRTIEETQSALATDSDLLHTDERASIDAAIKALEAATTTDDRDAMDAAHELLKQRITPFAEARMNKAIKKALAGNRVADMNS